MKKKKREERTVTQWGRDGRREGWITKEQKVMLTCGVGR